MDDEKIISLAREYRQHANYPFEDMTEAKLVAMDVIKWLSKTHCIIPKVDAINQHTWYMQRMEEVSSNRQMNRGKAIALETLLGKELFNGTEE